MATQLDQTRFALTSAVGPAVGRGLPSGAWWPESRSLTDQLGGLFQAWPDEQGRIIRVLYSPPDWDDHPHAVEVPGRRIKTGSFPHDDTHELILSLLDGRRRTITVIPPGTSAKRAGEILEGFRAGQGRAEQPVWENEGGPA